MIRGSYYFQYDSLQYGKGKRKVKLKDRKKEKVLRIDIWDDIFLHTDKASSQNYGILLMRVNGVHNNKSSLSGTAEVLKILSYIPSTYVLQLSGKSSEEQLEYLTFLNQNLPIYNKKTPKNLLLSIKHWVCRFYFDQGYGADQKIIKNQFRILNFDEFNFITNKMQLFFIED